MKKFLIPAAMVLLLAGCSSPTPAPTVTVTAAAPASAAPAGATDAAHEQFRHDVLAATTFANPDPAALDTVGDTVCQAFDDGTSESDIGDNLVTHGDTAEQASTVTVYAVFDLCPSNKDQLAP